MQRTRHLFAGRGAHETHCGFLSAHAPFSMESLRIYNTLARDKQTFVPLQEGVVRMYVCGMTVYDYCHVGHARVMVVFDIVQRWLRTLGYDVTYVRNITDIDDKIIRRAVENGETIKALTDRFIKALHEDADALGIQRPDIEPRATDFIPQMLGMIEQLEANGYAYQASDGDVNYAVRKFANYGKLSGKSEEPADTGWDSKYGRGRPGWHIECSAMGCTLLGEHFDIHGGGQDLQFPHHENEIAQSEAATGQTFVNFWMHNGYVQIDNEKMSKSLNNFFTIREVLAQYDAEVVRFFIARAHYRSPLNYSDVHIDDARNALARLYTALKDVTPDDAELDWNEAHAQRFQAAMNDDFNTPVAVSVLFELATEVNRTRDPALARQLRSLGAVIGLLGREPRAYLQQAAGAAAEGALEPAAIEAKIAARVAAKQAKDYAAADRIRAELLEAGVALEDKPGGLTEWRRV
jgi:cysteinyl-tRNA synthetase